MARPADPDPVALAQALIRCPSVTPADAGVLAVLAGALEPLGFRCSTMRFESPGHDPIDNLYARLGDGGPHLCFAGHTDVVPPGDPALWSDDPFSGTVRDGMLWGRGATDMKGAIACFVAAVARDIAARGGPPPGSVSLLITGDEEADAVNGTVRMLEALSARGETIDACVVGEPTNPAAIGDAIKIGRRGSLNAHLTIHGTQGHTAYPHRADNPAHRLVATLHALTGEPLDAGSDHFEASTLAVTSIDIGNPTTNVIPARAEARFNIRFNDRHSGASLSERLHAVCRAHAPRYALDIRVSGESFLSPPDAIADTLADAVEEVTGRRPALDTGGGTSDARFIQAYCPVAEFGLVGQTMHAADERTAVADMAALTDIYAALLRRYFAP
jgi:succinyl-diaminopimelate desuccinylase